MISVKEVTEALGLKYNRGTAGHVGRLLKEAGIGTVKKQGKVYGSRVYLDVHSNATVDGIVRRLKRQPVLKAEVADQGRLFKYGSEVVGEAGIEVRPEPKLTLEKALLVIERMATKIDDLETAVASLRVQLGAANSVKVSDVVKRAVAVYGD